jgi:O-methyltransferase
MAYQGDIIVHTQADCSFMNDERFKEAYAKTIKIDKERLLGTDSAYDIRWRVHTILWAAKHALSVPGDFLDLGCGFGLLSAALVNYLEFEKVDKKLFMVDSFCGLDIKRCSEEELERHRTLYMPLSGSNWESGLREEFDAYSNVKVIQGFAPKVLKKVPSNNFSFISIDLNSALAEKDSLKVLWPLLSKGGIIIFDDYAFPCHKDQKDAHDAFARENNLLIYTSPTGQGILMKP